MLNYFTAAADHRPEIALLIASLMEFPKEDVDKIKSAFRYSIIPTGSPFRAGLSLADQFVRFLENESVSAENAPSLPAPTDQARIRGPTPDPPQQPSPGRTATSDNNTGSHTSTIPQPPVESPVAALDNLLR
ncbi:hypothetical protein WR25_10119 [Diploscapter pachys]|uniref:GRIP domain-containing protein n=1 Tax=Diploscapter pachys TaxID=2018661 RepID=A0A2A2LEH7_9BILA|nr:hypothetical protein WR25_10119 [Diploscapter pachys]